MLRLRVFIIGICLLSTSMSWAYSMLARWQAATSPQFKVKGYRIDVKVGDEIVKSIDAKHPKADEAGVYSFVISDLALGPTYSYSITAYGNQDQALPSNEITVNYKAVIEPMYDSDQDLVEKAVDNCVRIPNPGQEDSDGDFAGDVCDDSVTIIAPELFESANRTSAQGHTRLNTKRGLLISGNIRSKSDQGLPVNFAPNVNGLRFYIDGVDMAGNPTVLVNSIVPAQCFKKTTTKRGEFWTVAQPVCSSLPEGLKKITIQRVTSSQSRSFKFNIQGSPELILNSLDASGFTQLYVLLESGGTVEMTMGEIGKPLLDATTGSGRCTQGISKGVPTGLSCRGSRH